MELCGDGHEVVCFECRFCPFCEVILATDREIRELEAQADDLRNDVSRLEDEVAGLEDEMVHLRERTNIENS